MRLLVSMDMYLDTCVLDKRNEPPPPECISFAKVLGYYTMRNCTCCATQKQKNKKTRGKHQQQARYSQEKTIREGLLLLKTKSTSGQWKTFRPTPKTRMPKGPKLQPVWARVRLYLQLPSIAGHSSLLILAMLQRQADFVDQKSNESGLYEVCAGDSSHRAQSRKVDENRPVRGLVRSFNYLRDNAQSDLAGDFRWTQRRHSPS